jgi:predicted nucleic acid-binding protein
VSPPPLLVLDASAYLELVLRTPLGLAVEDAIADRQLAAPHLFDAEVLHRLVRFGKHGVLDAREVDSAVADLADAPIHRCDHRPLLVRARRFAAALSGYDALYAAAAAAYGASLLTGDARFAATAADQLDIPVVALDQRQP